jgi:hypothetical protein
MFHPDETSPKRKSADLRLAIRKLEADQVFELMAQSVRELFGEAVHYGQLINGLRKGALVGNPDLRWISTSYVERQNVTMRMNIRRMAGRTFGYSKKLENHAAAIHLHFAPQQPKRLRSI